MPSIKKSLFHNTLFILSNLLFPLISFSYASRILGPEGFGKIQFVLVFAQYFIIIAAFGIPIYGVRETAKVRNDKNLLSRLISELLIIHILSSLLLFAIYIGIILTVGWFHNDLNLYIIGGIVVLTGFSSLDWFYNGMEQFHFLSFRSIIVKIFALGGLFLFVKTKNDLIIYFLLSVFTVLANNVWNLIKINNLINFSYKNLKISRHIPALATLFGTSISIGIYTVIDTLLLGFMTNDITVGFYTAAVKIGKIAIPLVLVLGVVLIPQITQSIQNNKRQKLLDLSNKSFAFICLLGIPISFGLFVFAPEFILLISGAEFSSAILTTQIAAPLVLLIGLGHLFGFQLLIPGGREKYYFIATVAGMLISIILNLVLIPSLKDKGTAIATICGELIVSCISFYYVFRKMKLNFEWSLLFKSALACLPFFLIAHLLRLSFQDNLLKLAIAIPLAAFIYFLIQVTMIKNGLVQEGIALVKNKFKNIFTSVN